MIHNAVQHKLATVKATKITSRSLADRQPDRRLYGTAVFATQRDKLRADQDRTMCVFALWTPTLRTGNNVVNLKASVDAMRNTRKSIEFDLSPSPAIAPCRWPRGHLWRLARPQHGRSTVTINKRRPSSVWAL